MVYIWDFYLSLKPQLCVFVGFYIGMVGTLVWLSGSVPKLSDTALDEIERQTYSNPLFRPRHSQFPTQGWQSKGSSAAKEEKR